MKPADTRLENYKHIYRTTAMRLHELSQQQLQQWEILEERALEPNPFLSLRFIQPAIAHLSPKADVHILLTEKGTDTESKLVGVGVFETRTATSLLPIPHLKAYQAPGNSFLTGLLVDQDYAFNALTSLMEFLNKQSSRWSHLEFDLRSADEPFSKVLNHVTSKHGKHWNGYEFERSAIVPRDPHLLDPAHYLSKNRRKKLRRCRRELEALGEVDFKIIRDYQGCIEATRNFLELENQGWKKDEGQSFASNDVSTEFFLEMTENFAAADKVWFTELRIGNETVGSTCNLISGKSAVAFKSGWKHELQDLGIGNFQEVELARHAPHELKDLDLIDSGTGGRSWLKSLWPGRRRMATGVFAGSRLADTTTKSLLQLRSNNLPAPVSSDT